MHYRGLQPESAIAYPMSADRSSGLFFFAEAFKNLPLYRAVPGARRRGHSRRFLPRRPLDPPAEQIPVDALDAAGSPSSLTDLVRPGLSRTRSETLDT